MTSEPEKRTAQRHKTLKGARIVFNKGNSTMDCLVRQVSAAGAQLLFENALVVPDEFELLFAGDKLPTHSCRVVWRKQSRVGVQFKR